MLTGCFDGVQKTQKTPHNDARWPCGQVGVVVASPSDNIGLRTDQMLPVSAERVRKLVRELNRSKNRKWNCAVLSFSICITRDGLARQLGAYKHVVRAVWARCGREPVTNDRSNSCARCWSICQEAVDPAICTPHTSRKLHKHLASYLGFEGKMGG